MYLNNIKKSRKVHKDVFKNGFICETVTQSLMTSQNIEIMLISFFKRN